MWVLWSLSLMIWSTHCCCLPHLKDDDKRSEILAQFRQNDLLVAREARRKRRAEGTSQVILSGCDGVLYPAENKEDNAHMMDVKKDDKKESYVLWVLWSELFMWVLWSLILMIWIACSVPALSEICMKDGNKPFDVWKMPFMEDERWGAQILLGPHISVV